MGSKAKRDLEADIIHLTMAVCFTLDLTTVLMKSVKLDRIHFSKISFFKVHIV